MRRILYPILVGVVLSCNISRDKGFNKEDAKDELQFCVDQYLNMMETLPPSRLPRNTEPDGKLRCVETADWTSGFYPGTLWYLYQYSNVDQLLTEAKRSTGLLKSQMYNSSTHDLGFMLFNSYGNGFRLNNEHQYVDILMEGGYTLASRFNDTIGCIKSWDWNEEWEFPVIVDNMMNLEYLFWQTRITGDSSFYNMAISHADNTLIDHYRPNHSTVHVVNYETSSGEIIDKFTVQGLSDESTWARGQAWGLYGFTMMYRETKDPKYFDHAVKIADFLFSHPRMPQDLIPFWDFDSPDIPNAPRDVSAAAITASSLMELQGFADGQLQREYLSKAESILSSLSSEVYRAKLGENNNFILKHSTGHFPAGKEIDCPIIYADYYYVEALTRFLSYHVNKKI